MTATMPDHSKDGKTDAEQYIDQLDRNLQTGDVAYDLNDGSWLYIVGEAAETVAEYDDRNSGRSLLSYAGNQLTRCTGNDSVYSAVHLNKNTTKSAGSGRSGSGVYDYPEGRLVRFVPETADDDLRRPQDEQRIQTIAALLTSQDSIDDRQDLRDEVVDVFGPGIARAAAGRAGAELLPGDGDDDTDDTDGQA